MLDLNKMINFLLENTKNDARWDCISKAKEIIMNKYKKINDPSSPPNKDKVPAMLLPGESIISRNSFDKWAKKGYKKLKKLNNKFKGEK